MEKVRETWLDAARGACVLSVMFIHTVYWSGYGYVPEYMRTLALLLDVPAFFFLAGVTLGVTGKSRVPAAAFSFILYFSVIALVHDALSGEWSFVNLVKCLTLENPNMQYLPVVGGSYWFVPVFVVVSLFGAAIVECAPRLIKLVILLLFHFYALEFFIYPQWKDLTFTVLGADIHFVLFYLALYLFGFSAWKAWLAKGKKMGFWLLPAMALAGFAAMYMHEGSKVFILQNYKFMPQLPYVLLAFVSIGLIGALWNNAKKNRALEYLGKNALAWYAGQGVGASLLMFVAESINLVWPVKLLLLFGLNIACSGIVAELLLRLDKGVRSWLRPVVANR